MSQCSATQPRQSFRAYVIQSTMALPIAGSSLRPGLAVRLSTRLTMTMQVADDGHDLDRLAIGVLLVPFAWEQSAARESAGCAMIQ